LAQTLRFPDSRSLPSLPTGVGVRLDESPTPLSPHGWRGGTAVLDAVSQPSAGGDVSPPSPLPWVPFPPPLHPPCVSTPRDPVPPSLRIPGRRPRLSESFPPPVPDPFPPISRRAPFDRSYPMAYAMGYGADPAFYPPGGQMAMPPPGYDFPHFPGGPTIPPPPRHKQRTPTLSVSIVSLFRFTHRVCIVYRCPNALPKKHT